MISRTKSYVFILKEKFVKKQKIIIKLSFDIRLPNQFFPHFRKTIQAVGVRFQFADCPYLVRFSNFQNFPLKEVQLPHIFFASSNIRRVRHLSKRLKNVLSVNFFRAIRRLRAKLFRLREDFAVIYLTFQRIIFAKFRFPADNGRAIFPRLRRFFCRIHQRRFSV